MTVGFELWRDGAAEPFFGTALPAGLILGGADLTDGNNSGTIIDANINNGTPFYFLSGAGAQTQPTVTFGSGSITWTADPDGAHYVGRLFYGIR